MNNLYLVHHGIRGQKWGVRRYQNEDGSLTPAGAQRYNKIRTKYDKRISSYEKSDSKIMAAREKNRGRIEERYQKKINKIQKDIDSFDPIKDGSVNKRGRTILTKDDVQQAVKGLEEVRKKLENKRDAKLKDFDNGTEAVKYGQEHYNNVLKNYAESKAMASIDKTFKNSPEYAKAVRDYTQQVLSDMWYGSRAASTLGYAGEYAKEHNF